MKTKYIILAAALICSTATFAQDGQRNKFNNQLNQGLSNSSQQSQGTIEQELRDKLIPILRSASLNDARYFDQNGEKSVDFTYNGKNYWFTADRGAQGTIELTLTRNGKKMYNDDKTLMYNEVAVLQAINEINTKYFSIKMYYDQSEGGIRICQQTTVRTVSSLAPEAIKKNLKDMENAWEEYSRFYSKYSGDEPVQDNPNAPGTFQEKPISKVTVQSIVIESVDGNGNKLAQVENGRIVHNKMQFIHPTIICSSSEPNTYDIQIKVIDEKGVVQHYPDNPNITMSGSVELKKKDKQYEAALGNFGSPDYKDWKKGKYTVEVYENEAKIYTTEFTIY